MPMRSLPSLRGRCLHERAVVGSPDVIATFVFEPPTHSVRDICAELAFHEPQREIETGRDAPGSHQVSVIHHTRVHEVRSSTNEILARGAVSGRPPPGRKTVRMYLAPPAGSDPP